MRKILIIWALLSFLAPVYSLMITPFIKLPTVGAVHTIETDYIDLESMTKEQKKYYEFQKGWILTNDQSLRRTARNRHRLISVLGIISGVLALAAAVRWPKLANQANTHENQSGES